MSLIRIKQAAVYQYLLPLVAPLPLKSTRLLHREGLIVELQDDQGLFSYGEAAPLADFSTETMADSERQLSSVLSELCGRVINTDAFECSLRSGENFSPSVAFALECAVHGFSIQQFPANLAVAPLLSGNNQAVTDRLEDWQGDWPTEFKFKVGRQSVADDIDTVQMILGCLPKQVSLRLDANRRWSFNEASQFTRSVAVDRISYIEEPLLDASVSKYSELFQATGLKFALDETLQDPAYHFRPAEGLAALIIKPTLVGGVMRCRHQVAEAREAGVRSVFSSSFESGIGVRMIGWLSSELAPDESPGLDTLTAFQRPLCEPLPEPGMAMPRDVAASMELLWHSCPVH